MITMKSFGDYENINPLTSGMPLEQFELHGVKADLRNERK